MILPSFNGIVTNVEYPFETSACKHDVVFTAVWTCISVFLCKCLCVCFGFFFRALLPTQTACMEHHVWSVVHALPSDFLTGNSTNVWFFTAPQDFNWDIFYYYRWLYWWSTGCKRYHILEYLSHHKFHLSRITVCTSHFWPDFMFSFVVLLHFINKSDWKGKACQSRHQHWEDVTFIHITIEIWMWSN